ncbi:hypothetical protein [Mycoplasma crocodyli]|uniref:Uncharacterized protein n=1 Tax=Mycoplasma crocodyli (strain ATCC 51981 / MP145) TaxID=512564 RepID=D5E4V0_MYCCM|nr:hypothetical protein [Mycoplasma crocodyli]ADE19732.1 hypothetical protein MCRO_0119 [Mycoplasma crocodyli MP145]
MKNKKIIKILAKIFATISLSLSLGSLFYFVPIHIRTIQQNNYFNEVNYSNDNIKKEFNIVKNGDKISIKINKNADKKIVDYLKYYGLNNIELVPFYYDDSNKKVFLTPTKIIQIDLNNLNKEIELNINKEFKYYKISLNTKGVIYPKKIDEYKWYVLYQDDKQL